MSNQIVSTPPDFIAAVEKRFGKITFDIAANEFNKKAESYLGPGSPIAENAFLEPWIELGDLAWLNPPFADIAPWAERCAKYRPRQRIALLVPATPCTNYFIEHVKPNAYVFEVTPRVFKKEIRDCFLALFEPAGYVGRETWQWKGD
jgi:hypothetical protein